MAHRHKSKASPTQATPESLEPQIIGGDMPADGDMMKHIIKVLDGQPMPEGCVGIRAILELHYPDRVRTFEASTGICHPYEDD